MWRRHVAPCATDLARVAAHYAIAGPTEGYGDPAEIHAFRVERRQWARVAVDDASLSIGRVRVTARVTEESEEVDVTVLDDGDGQIHARVRTRIEADALAAAREALLGLVPLRGRAEWTRELEQHFGGRAYTTADVFLDERRRLVAGLAERVLDGSAGAPVETASRQLLGELRRVEGPIPPGLADVARRLLARAARDELARLAEGGPVAESTRRLREVLAEARSLAISLGLRTEDVTRAIGSALGCALETLRAQSRQRPPPTPSRCSRSATRSTRRSICGRRRTPRPACGARDRGGTGRRWRRSCPPSDSLPGRSRVRGRADDRPQMERSG